MSKQRLLSIVLLVIGLSVLSRAPGLIPVLLIAAGVLSRQWKQQNRGSLIDWLSEQLGLAQKDDSQERQDDPFREMRRDSSVKRDPKFPGPNFGGRSPARQNQQEDAYSYSQEDEKYSSQQYIGSTGKDPWDLPPEHPPWEK